MCSRWRRFRLRRDVVVVVVVVVVVSHKLSAVHEQISTWARCASFGLGAKLLVWEDCTYFLVFSP